MEFMLVGMDSFVDGDPWGDPPGNRPDGQPWGAVRMVPAEDGGDRLETDCNSLLSKFHDWALNGGVMPHHDNHVLLSGRDFSGQTVGYADMSSMCRAARSGSVNECHRLQDGAGCASVLAHELGHHRLLAHERTDDTKRTVRQGTELSALRRKTVPVRTSAAPPLVWAEASLTQRAHCSHKSAPAPA